MKLEPKKDWMIGRLVVTKPSSTILLADYSKHVSKFILVEAVSEGARAAGFDVGQLVMPTHMQSIFLRGGAYHRVSCSIENVLCVVYDEPLTEFMNQDGSPVLPVEESPSVPRDGAAEQGAAA